MVRRNHRVDRCHLLPHPSPGTASWTRMLPLRVHDRTISEVLVLRPVPRPHEAMSDTPRTDAYAAQLATEAGAHISWVNLPPDFARKLERELNEWHSTARQYLEDSVKLTEGFNSELSAMTSERDEWKRLHDDISSRLTRLLSGLPRTGCKANPVE